MEPAPPLTAAVASTKASAGGIAVFPNNSKVAGTARLIRAKPPQVTSTRYSMNVHLAKTVLPAIP